MFNQSKEVELLKKKNIILVLGLFISFLFLGGCVEPVGSQQTVINPELGGITAGTEMNGGGSSGGTMSGGGMVNLDGRPELMRIGDKVAIVGELLSIQLSASDPQNDVLTFSLRSVLPDGAKFEKDRGLFTWTPTQEQIGSVLLTFEVSDGTLKDQETIAVRVSAAGSQEEFPPMIDPIGSILINAGEPWQFQLVGEDLNNQRLAYRLSGMIPNGLELNAMTGLVTWTPTQTQIGQYDLVAAVSDGQSEASTPMIIIVQDANSQSNSNRPPVFNQTPPQSVVAGQTVSFEISAMDEMPGSLMYQAESIPDGAQFNPDSRVFTWTPSQDQSGTSHDAVFVVRDIEYRAFLSVSIEVTRAMNSCPADPAGMSGGSVPLTEGNFLQDRVLCDQSETDSYQITLDRPGRIDVTATFDNQIGDIDLFLFDSTGQRVGLANGFTNEERLTSQNLTSGIYRLDVKLYGNGGPSLYSVGYTILENTAICMADVLEGPGNNNATTATAINSGQDYSLGLCNGDIDYFTFNVDRGDEINIAVNFTHNESDIDIRLESPLDSGGDPFSEWQSVSGTDDEYIAVPSAPIAGTYLLEVKQSRIDREAQYNLRVDITSAGECAPDRFEPADEPQSSEPIGPELYGNLRACSDEDWFVTNVNSGRSLIIYITYDGGTPIVSAQNAYGAITPIGQTFFDPVDGCLSDRLNCKRYYINPGPMGGAVYYGISFYEIGVDYDLRVRVGDEVGATCYDDLDCNTDYECLYAFANYTFETGLCAKECQRDSDCGSNRTCIANSLGGSSMCMQRCDTGFSCRYEFACTANLTNTSGQTVSACLSNTYIEE